MSQSDRTETESHGTSPDLWMFLALVVVALGSMLLLKGGLSFEPYTDESMFWNRAVWFADRLPPDVESLRSYAEPMTPLSFLMWGAFEKLTGLGIAGARFVTLMCSVWVLCLIGVRSKGVSRLLFLAISTRQYMVVFPAAIVAHEVSRAVMQRDRLDVPRVLPVWIGRSSCVLARRPRMGIMSKAPQRA